MNKLVTAGLAMLCISAVQAQQKEGKTIYERTSQFTMSFGQGEPTTQVRKDKFELNFSNNQMSWRQLEDEIQDDNGGAGNGGVMLRTMGGGDDMTFCDFTQALKVEQREFFDKKYIVSDSIRKGNWKLSEDTKTILGHLCRKATSQRISQRMTMTMENGKTERKEVGDTSSIVAWFTTDIPVSAGPEVAGQLPGMILELETNNGRSVYKAIEITAKPDLAAIKVPTKGKKVTPSEFTAERNKMMAEMQKNNGGRSGMTIRMN